MDVQIRSANYHDLDGGVSLFPPIKYLEACFVADWIENE
jgi:hypothetical protein